MRVCNECSHVDGDHEMDCYGSVVLFELQAVIETLKGVEEELDSLVAGAFVSQVRQARIGLSVLRANKEKELYKE